MKCTKKMICEIFNEAAKEMGYKETQTNISNFKYPKIRWTRSANRSFIKFSVTDYLIGMSDKAVRDAAVKNLKAIDWDRSYESYTFNEELLSDGYVKRNQKKFLKRYEYIDEYDQRIQRILDEMSKDMYIPETLAVIVIKDRRPLNTMATMNVIMIAERIMPTCTDEFLKFIIRTGLYRIEQRKDAIRSNNTTEPERYIPTMNDEDENYNKILMSLEKKNKISYRTDGYYGKEDSIMWRE